MYRVQWCWTFQEEVLMMWIQSRQTCNREKNTFKFILSVCNPRCSLVSLWILFRVCLFWEFVYFESLWESLRVFVYFESLWICLFGEFLSLSILRVFEFVYFESLWEFYSGFFYLESTPTPAGREQRQDVYTDIHIHMESERDICIHINIYMLVYIYKYTYTY